MCFGSFGCKKWLITWLANYVGGGLTRTRDVELDAVANFVATLIAGLERGDSLADFHGYIDG
jgi:hypothetical protein